MIQLLHTSWMRQLTNKESSWISISMSRSITASRCLLPSKLCMLCHDRLLTDGLPYFLVQKQLTENEVANQKANVAAMRADVTADTTQIAHKILRCCLLQVYPASLQLLLHAGLHARDLTAFQFGPFAAIISQCIFDLLKPCESCKLQSLCAQSIPRYKG